jgi:hypothetical protein
MIEYQDPVIPLVQFFKRYLPEIHVYGNMLNEPRYPALMVRVAGGIGFSRIQLLVRAEKDYEAMQYLIQAMNKLQKDASVITSLPGSWCEKEGNPIPSVDTDTGKPEAWVYLRLEHLGA